MIRYDPSVTRSTRSTDGFPRQSEAYDAQAALPARVVCPICGSTTVAKQLMTPGIPAKSNQRAEGRMPVFAGRNDEKVSELIEAVAQAQAA